MTTVGIFGAGMAGLTIADELSKRGFTVYLFDAQNDVGGLARSSSGKLKVPTEVSWRGIGPFYHNMLAKMKEIKYDDGSTFDYGLVRPMPFNIVGADVITIADSLTFFDRFVLGYLVHAFKTGTDEYRKSWIEYNAADYLKTKLSSSGWRAMTCSIGPFIGVDPARCSMFQFLNFYALILLSDYTPEYKNKKYKWSLISCTGLLDTNCGLWSLFGGSSKDALFDPWRSKLQNQQVNIRIKHKLISLNSDSKIIKSVTVLVDGKETNYVFDHYILATSPFGTVDILRNSRKNKHIANLLRKHINLTADGPHIQIPFTIKFKESVNMERSAYIFGDSPFDLTLYFQSDTWKEVGRYTGKGSFWSGTICIGYANGLLYNKPVSRLTKEEFFDEVYEQIMESTAFDSLVKSSNDGKDLDYFMHRSSIDTWHTFTFSPTGIESTEPKWVNSTKNEKYRLANRTQFNNLYLSGAHTLTSMSLYSMEGAVESGLMAVNALLSDHFDFVEPCNIYQHLV